MSDTNANSADSYYHLLFPPRFKRFSKLQKYAEKKFTRQQESYTLAEVWPIDQWSIINYLSYLRRPRRHCKCSFFCWSEKAKRRAPIGVWKSFFPYFIGNYYKPTNRQTDMRVHRRNVTSYDNLFRQMKKKRQPQTLCDGHKEKRESESRTYKYTWQNIYCHPNF